jgi:CP family cyanate transporter-like MFS transporter
LNLRPFLTSVGPVLDLVRADIGLDFRAAAMLTTLPFVLMGLIAFIGIGVARRFGERRALAGALLLLMLGCASRAVVKDGAQLIIGAGIAGTGVAVIQALIPGVAKRWFPERIAMVMGLYSAALVGGGALGSLASTWLNAYGGWRLGLSIWALPALAVFLLWLVWSKPAASSRIGVRGSWLPTLDSPTAATQVWWPGCLPSTNSRTWACRPRATCLRGWRYSRRPQRSRCRCLPAAALTGVVRYG